MEKLIGRNLNAAEGEIVTLDQDLHQCDGATTPATVILVPSGEYRITRKSGKAPGQVSYYGQPVSAGGFTN